jgi:hypothetical protein
VKGSKQEQEYINPSTIQFIEDGIRRTTHPTVSITVHPDTLSSAVAHDTAISILGILGDLNIQCAIDVAFYESVPTLLHSQFFSPPAHDLHPLRKVLGPLSTSVGMSISGRNTMYMQGTLGGFCWIGTKFCAFTARHNLFPKDGDNKEYNHNGMYHYLSINSRTMLRPHLRIQCHGSRCHGRRRMEQLLVFYPSTHRRPRMHP